MPNICNDNDPKCPHCAGNCTRLATQFLRRIDMDDTGSKFCDRCAEDILESGVFSATDISLQNAFWG